MSKSISFPFVSAKEIGAGKNIYLFNGAVDSNGKFISSPGSGWVANRIGEGEYAITHPLGTPDCSLSLSLINQPGSYKLVSMDHTMFVINTTLDGLPKDSSFIFSMTRVAA